MANTRLIEILNSYFELKKKRNKGFSLRALAKSLNLSPSFLSAILSGKRNFPLQRFDDLVASLEIDTHGKKALLKELRSSFPKALELLDRTKTTASDVEAYTKKSSVDSAIFSDWFDVALLDLSTCENFSSSPGDIAKRLGITVLQAKSSLEKLQRHSYLKVEDGKLRKSESKLRFPTAKSLPAIRRYHEMMIRKSLDVLRTQTSDQYFSKRLIVSLTFAAGSERVEKALADLHEAIYESAETLSSGACDQVYQLNLQVFPLSQDLPVDPNVATKLVRGAKNKI